MFGKQSFLSRICFGNRKPTGSMIKTRCEPPGLPSQVFNRLSVKGSRADLEQFRLAVGGCGIKWSGVGEYGHFNFDSIVPIPQDEIRSMWRLRSQVRLEELRIKHWNVNSEAWGCTLKAMDHELIFNFCTASEPPKKIIGALVERYPFLRFQMGYANRNLGIEGVFIGKHGKLYHWAKTKFTHESKQRPRAA